MQYYTLKDVEDRPQDTYLKQEMRRVAEAVLLAIDPEMEIALQGGGD